MSDWVASMTCLNSVFNGSFGGYSAGYKEELRGFDKKDSYVAWFLTYANIIANCFVSK